MYICKYRAQLKNSLLMLPFWENKFQNTSESSLYQSTLLRLVKSKWLIQPNLTCNKSEQPTRAAPMLAYWFYPSLLFTPFHFPLQHSSNFTSNFTVNSKLAWVKRLGQGLKALFKHLLLCLNASTSILL